MTLKRLRSMPALLAVATPLVLAASPSPAQWFYAPRPPLPPHMVADILIEDYGFRRVARPSFDGRFYRTEGIDARGVRVVALVNAHSGRVMEMRPLQRPLPQVPTPAARPEPQRPPAPLTRLDPQAPRAPVQRPPVQRKPEAARPQPAPALPVAPQAAIRPLPEADRAPPLSRAPATPAYGATSSGTTSSGTTLPAPAPLDDAVRPAPQPSVPVPVAPLL